jgi:DNA modification methylase
MSEHRIIFGDAKEVLRTLPEESVDCVFTSPPYWSLRDYGVAGQIGLEATVEEYVARLVEVFVEVRRVLKPAGTVALVLGDCYALSGPSALVEAGVVVNRRPKSGLKPKDMVGVPWRVAFGLQDDGWWLRNDIIWQKLNPLPESVTDRFAATHEHVFLLSRSARYWFDLNAVRVQHRSDHAPGNQSRLYVQRSRIPERLRPDQAHSFHPLGKNPGDVVTLPAQPTPFAHFATFPVALVLRILPALCPPRVCSRCGKPWEHRVKRTGVRDHPLRENRKVAAQQFSAGDNEYQDGGTLGKLAIVRDLGYFPACACHGRDLSAEVSRALKAKDEEALAAIMAERDAIPDDTWRPGTVLDPFLGSGTVTEAARKLGVNSIGIELNPAYEAVMRQRLGQLHTLEGSVRFETIGGEDTHE